VVKAYFDEFTVEVNDVYKDLPHLDFSKPSSSPLGHWGENPMAPFEFNPFRDMSLPRIEFPMFEQPKQKTKPFNIFGRPDEMDFMHFPKLELPDLHLF